MSRKNLMAKLRHSFSVKSFSLKSYQSSLICNKKTFRLNVNLTNGLASPKDSFVSKYLARNSRNMTKNDWEASRQDDQNLKTWKNKNKFLKSSSFVKKSPEIEKLKELSNSEDSPRSLVEDRDSPRPFVEDRDSPRSSYENEKLNLKITVKPSHQVKKRNSVNTVRTTNQNSSEGKSISCEVCMKFFSSKYNLKRHSILHSLVRHACSICRKEFQTKENLKRHCRAIHELRMKSIACSRCYKAFSRNLDLKIHLKKHPDHVQ